MLRSFAVLVILLFVFGSPKLHAQKQSITGNAGPAVTSADVNAVIRAIQDEIYTNNLEAEGYDAGVPAGKAAYRLQLYIQPAFNDQGLAWAIYKLMPYGEVLRMFWIRSDGTAFLYGKPKVQFSPTGPSYLTAYMDDEELLRDKQTWKRTCFTIALEPSAEDLREAHERQKRRIAATTSLVSASEAAADYRDSQRAANESAVSADPTGGATHYFLDYGQPLPIWAIGVSPVKTFGPFLKTLQAGKPAKDVKVRIVIIR